MDQYCTLSVWFPGINIFVYIGEIPWKNILKGGTKGKGGLHIKFWKRGDYMKRGVFYYKGGTWDPGGNHWPNESL